MKKLLSFLMVPLTLLALASPAAADNSNDQSYVTSLGSGLCLVQNLSMVWITSTGTPRQFGDVVVGVEKALSGNDCSSYTNNTAMKVNTIGSWGYIEGKASVGGASEICVQNYDYNAANVNGVSIDVPPPPFLVGLQCPTTDTWVRIKAHTAVVVGTAWVYTDRYTAWMQVNP